MTALILSEYNPSERILNAFADALIVKDVAPVIFVSTFLDVL
jgi:hypothetical protein